MCQSATVNGEWSPIHYFNECYHRHDFIGALHKSHDFLTVSSIASLNTRNYIVGSVCRYISCHEIVLSVTSVYEQDTPYFSSIGGHLVVKLE